MILSMSGFSPTAVEEWLTQANQVSRYIMSPPTLILQISCKETASHFSGPEYSKVKAADPFYIFLLLSVILMKRRPEPVCGSQLPVHLFLMNTQILRN